MSRAKPILNKAMIIVAVLLVLIGGYIWIVQEATDSDAGISLEKQFIGQLLPIDGVSTSPTPRQVVKTPEASWLVTDHTGEATLDIPVIRRNEPSSTKSHENSTPHPLVTLISKKSTGSNTFDPVMIIEGTAWLYTTTGGRHLFLLAPSDKPMTPTTVFRSDDQGKSWHSLKHGFPYASDQIVTGKIKPPYFHDHGIWAWADTANISSITAVTKPILYYSSDLGETLEPVTLDQSFFVDQDHARRSLPSHTDWRPVSDKESNQTLLRSIVQLDERKAMLWIVQQFAFSSPYDEHRTVLTTTQLELNRRDDQWQAHVLQRTEGEALYLVQQNRNGQVIGLRQRDEGSTAEVVELNMNTRQWQTHGRIPNPFSPLPAKTLTFELLLGDNMLVATTGSLFHPFYRSNEDPISTMGVYYSNDLGASWQRLAMKYYSDNLGFDSEKNRLYSTPFDGYKDPARTIYAHDFQ